MKQKVYLLLWTIVIPILAWLGYFGISLGLQGWIFHVALSLLLMGSVLAAVHHASVSYTPLTLPTSDLG